ncbi:MAG: hypothetical protein WCI51_15725 [Lentisphaerota bacterium]
MKKTLAYILHFLDRDFSLSKRQVLFAALALLIIGLGLRCGYWTMRDRPPRDEKFYIQTVENINNGDNNWVKKSGYISPLMQQMAAFACRFGISAETALHALNMVYSMLWVLIMFFLCRDVFDNYKVALLGMMLAVFNPYSIRMSSQILREPLYILIFTVSLWLAVKFIKNQGVNLLYPLLLAVLTILGFLTRYEGIEISLFLPLAIIVIFMQYKWQRFRMCIYGLAVYLFTVGLIIGMLINFNNAYMRNAHQKAIDYFAMFTGNELK